MVDFRLAGNLGLSLDFFGFVGFLILLFEILGWYLNNGFVLNFELGLETFWVQS